MLDNTEQTDGAKQSVGDERGPSWGPGRLVMALFWVFGAVTTGLAVWSLFQRPEDPIGPRLVALLAGLIYLLVAVGITHNGRRMRMIAWCGVIITAVGPVITGLLGLGLPDAPDLLSSWSRFGADYCYFPLLMPVVGVVWMWRSDPRRIVEIAEGIERTTRRR